MLGLTEESMWIVVVVAGAAFLAFVFLTIIGGEAGPTGFAYKIFRSMWYDLMYFFFGPRIVEV
ncbi:MAG: hypothetical protein QXD77_00050 [Candidatus Aenigmatarchaeota archaeon]